MSENEWRVYERARQLWLAAATKSRADSWVCMTFGATVIVARGLAGWMS